MVLLQGLTLALAALAGPSATPSPVPSPAPPSAPAAPSSEQAVLERSASGERIPDLQVEAVGVKRDGAARSVLLRVSFTRVGWTLQVSGAAKKLSDKLETTAQLEPGAITGEVVFAAVDAKGVAEREKITLRILDAEPETAEISPWDTIEILSSRGGALPEASLRPDDLKWPMETRWRFNSNSPRTPVGHPVLKTWIQVPLPWVAEDFSSTDGTVLEASPEDSPFDRKRGAVFSFQTEKPVARFRAKVIDEKNEAKTLDLAFTVKSPGFFHWADASCAEAGVQIATRHENAKEGFAAARCETGPETVDLYLFLSPGLAFKDFKLEKKTGEGPGWMRFRLARAASRNSEQRKLIGSFELESGKYSVAFTPLRRQQGFTLSAGAGVTSLSYTEDPGSIKESQLGITAKLNASVPLIEGKLDLSGNFFFTLLNLTHSPSTLEAARFFGFNFRFGTPLGVKWFGWSWSAHLGWYFQGMIVPNNRYGIQLLNGPQAFLITRMPSGAKTHFAYLKYAPINDKPVLPSFSSFEFAFGGGYQLTGAGSRVWHLTADLSTLTFTSSTDGNHAAWFTGTLGVQTPL